MKKPRMLVLWDIDRTLLTTGGAGKNAFSDAGREIFGAAFTLDTVDTLGRLDSLILRDALRVAGLGVPGPLEGRFRKAYLDRLKTELSARPTIRLLPGVRMLHERLTGVLSVTQGILSGNYPKVGKLKLKVCGLCPDRFEVWVGGADGKSRRDLVPVALDRYARLAGVPIAPGKVVIIGDTPRDIDCARANGCRSLAVATGSFPKEALDKAGADLVLEDLVNTEKILNWIFRGPFRDVRGTYGSL